MAVSIVQLIILQHYRPKLAIASAENLTVMDIQVS